MAGSSRRTRGFTTFAAAFVCLQSVALPIASAEGIPESDQNPACFLVPSDSLQAAGAGEFVSVTICHRTLFDEQFPVINRGESGQYSSKFRAPEEIHAPVQRKSALDQTIALIEHP